MFNVKQLLKRLFCRHSVSFVEFDPEISVMTSTCQKCGSVKSYPIGRIPVKYKGKWI